MDELPAADIQATIATQGQVTLDDVAQTANKIAEVTPPPCVTRVSSGADISTLTARIDELARQVAALPRAPLVCVRLRRHDGTQEARHTMTDGHQALTSADTTAGLKSVLRDAPRPARSSRQTGTAVASGGEQPQKLSQPLLCDGSAVE